MRTLNQTCNAYMKQDLLCNTGLYKLPELTCFTFNWRNNQIIEGFRQLKDSDNLRMNQKLNVLFEKVGLF